MYLCICCGIRESQVKKTAKHCKYDMERLRCQTGLGNKCGACRSAARQLVQQAKKSDRIV